jgi:hypothetical protein
MLDASAPWIAGLDVPVRARLGQREGALTILASYLAAYDAAPVPLPEFAAGPGARHGAGRSDDAGRSWDNAAWFAIVYEGHYGLLPTPAALRIRPAPLRAIPGDTLAGYRYGKARVTLTLAEDTYTVRVDQPCALILLPMGADTRVALDDGAPAPSISIQARPGQTYTIRSGGAAGEAARTPTALPPTATAVPATATPQPPTATPLPPTATPEPPTATPEPPPTTEPPPPTAEPPPAASGPPPAPPPASPFRATDRIGAPVPVNLRAGPGAGFATLGALPPGTPLAATGESASAGGVRWRRFSLADGRAGWVREVDVLPAP